MSAGPEKRGFLLTALVYCLCAVAALSQTPDVPKIPAKFDLDMKTAARLRPGLLAHSSAAEGRYAAGARVFQTLVATTPRPQSGSLSWELRIAHGEPWNAFSSPDGTVYVDNTLAELAGSDPGLWAAILSHEIAHVLRRDWARRYLYEKSLRDCSANLTSSAGSLGTDSWLDPRTASESLARFCRQLEVAADADGLMLMARAGYHPDFALALHHILHAQMENSKTSPALAMHPRWEARDRELQRAYVAAGLEFDRTWPERGASPGGNPPVLVFAEAPVITMVGSGRWEIQLTMRCQNLAGTVEVVLRKRDDDNAGNSADGGVHELTGCTSDRTLISLPLDDSVQPKHHAVLNDIYVLDDRGAVLSRAELPELRR